MGKLLLATIALMGALATTPASAQTPQPPGASVGRILTNPPPYAPRPNGAFACFADPGSRLSLYSPLPTPGGHDLSGQVTWSLRTTNDACRATCASQNFVFAGTQSGAFCFCGNTAGTHGAVSDCTAPCAGSPGEMCGGTSAKQRVTQRRAGLHAEAGDAGPFHRWAMRYQRERSRVPALRGANLGRHGQVDAGRSEWAGVFDAVDSGWRGRIGAGGDGQQRHAQYDDDSHPILEDFRRGRRVLRGHSIGQRSAALPRVFRGGQRHGDRRSAAKVHRWRTADSGGSPERSVGRTLHFREHRHAESDDHHVFKHRSRDGGGLRDARRFERNGDL